MKIVEPPLMVVNVIAASMRIDFLCLPCDVMLEIEIYAPPCLHWPALRGCDLNTGKL